jgi:hypothetical protein
VLLARSEFLARLERPLLHVWLARRPFVARRRAKTACTKSRSSSPRGPPWSDEPNPVITGHARVERTSIEGALCRSL